jgi:hypothetical protein
LAALPTGQRHVPRCGNRVLRQWCQCQVSLLLSDCYQANQSPIRLSVLPQTVATYGYQVLQYSIDKRKVAKAK